MSAFQKIPDAAGSVLVIGDEFTSHFLVGALHEAGVSAQGICLKSPIPNYVESGPETVFYGLGDPYGLLEKNAGETLAKDIWSASAQNFSSAADFLKKLNVEFSSVPLYRFGNSDVDKQRFDWTAQSWEKAQLLKSVDWMAKPFKAILREPAISFDGGKFCQALKAQSQRLNLSIATASSVTEIKKVGNFQCVTVCKDDEHLFELESNLVIIATPRIMPERVPFLENKWIPISLSNYLCDTTTNNDFSMGLFNGGADYVATGAEGYRFGSLRNLHSDKAVGFHAQLDPKTIEGIAAFFPTLGFNFKASELRVCQDIQAVTCDGLPIVGPPPQSPEILLVGGFAARRWNFIFWVAQHLISGILGKSSFERLGIFSTKRFV